jgi:2-polyprenyl-3-methyl-5-hydroxy-6-metoxy-1,4-benzoquinol methylase
MGDSPTDRHTELSVPSHWDRQWESASAHDYEGPVYDFHEIFRRILPRDGRLRLLEVGSARGFALVYFHKEYGYQISGLDRSEKGIEVAREHCRRNSVPARLYVGDLFALELPGPYDIVYSGGVLEHFADPRPALRRHVDFLRPGGLMVLGVPNVGGIHAPLLRRLHPEIYGIHNPAVCSPGSLRRLLEEA